ncbi:hypothetical protein C8J56DRAFT_962711 [Mycena floridula]|nr:hypothetical protein C8J56DRAFT_962711 [Mycena floridula]
MRHTLGRGGISSKATSPQYIQYKKFTFNTSDGPLIAKTPSMDAQAQAAAFAAVKALVPLIVGPLVIAVLVNTFLYGVCCLQFVIYFRSGGSLDPIHMKLFIAYELLVDTFHTASTAYMLWFFVVDNFLNPAVLGFALWPLTATPIITAMSSCPIQIYLAYRVMRLSNSKPLFAVLAALSLAQGILAMVSGGLAVSVTDYAAAAKFIPLVDSWLAVSVATDLAISASLVLVLRKRRTSFESTNRMISRLVSLAIESAAFATFFSIMLLVVFTAYTSTTLNMVFSLPMGRVYTNTLLATLNNRQSIRDENSSSIVNTFGDSGLVARMNDTVNILVERETTQDDVRLETLKTMDAFDHPVSTKGHVYAA